MSEAPAASILNVNDDDATRYAVTRTLQRAGFAVVEARTGAEGLRLAAANPDLIILDVNLPDINGVEVCRQIKADPHTATVTILHVSAEAIEARHRVQGLESGADGYLVQPVEPSELVATVRALLRIRRAEEEARNSARQWWTTFDAITDAVCLLDGDGRVREANRAMTDVLGKRFGEIVGQPYGELMEQALGLREIPSLDRIRETRQREVQEVRVGERWLRIAADPVLDARRNVTGVVHIIADITERKQGEEERARLYRETQEADRRKDEFLAMLGHELRNPLAAISNAIYVLEQVGSQEERPIQQRATISRQVRHLTRLVDDLLDVARITRGRIELRMQPLDLADIVQQAVQTALPRIENRQHTLSVSTPERPLWIEADPTRFEQVVVNLLDNAAKYTEPGGRIQIALEQDGPDALLRVQDTGIGLSADMLPRIFNLFAQVDQSLDRSRGGLGIGLTLVRSLVEMHGGQITADSQGVGQGSEFRVRLPLAAGLAASAAGRPERATAAEQRAGEDVFTLPAGAAQKAPRRVLLIEDNPDARETMADLLEIWGYEVETAADGEKGIEQARVSRPDVALVDIGLPGVDGYQVAGSIRKAEEVERGEPTLGASPPIFLIALTGYGQPEDRRRAVDAGFDAHLVKPVDPAALSRLLAGDST